MAYFLGPGLRSDIYGLFLLGLLRGAVRRDVVLFVDGKRRHNRYPLCHALRGHDIHHSVWEHKQENNAGNHERRWNGDDLLRNFVRLASNGI